MADNFLVLGISQDANPEQIQEAFARKRAELIASIEDDRIREESITELQKAYDEIRKKKNLALFDEEIPNRKIDPLLRMVNNLNAPVYNESSLFAATSCLFCGSKNPIEAQICTACGKQISRPCPKCGKILRIDTLVCPRCNTIIRIYNQTRLIESEHLKEVKESEREKDKIRVNALEEHHKQRAIYGFVFWFIVILVLICLYALTSFLISKLGLT